MSKVADPPEERRRAEAIGRRYLVRFEEDTLRQRPLWIRVIIEFLGTAACWYWSPLVRGLPDKQEREAAEGGALPL